MGLCFAPDCDHTSNMECKMFRFPNDPKLRKKWETLIRRGDRTSNKFSVVCSCHFENGDKSKLPTIFKRNLGKHFSFPLPQQKKRSNLSSTDKDNVSSGKGITVNVHDVQVPSTSDRLSVNVLNSEDRLMSGAAHTSSSTALLEAENYLLKIELEKSRQQLESFKMRFDFSFIKNNDKLINIYTDGFPDESIFMSVFTYLDEQSFKYYLGWSVVNISRMNQFLIRLMKLKLNTQTDN